MVTLAWWIGITGNSSFSLIFFICGSILIYKGTKGKKRDMALAGLSLVSFAAMLLSIVLLYQQGLQVQHDLDKTTSFWPFFMWLFNLLLSGLLLGLALVRYGRNSPPIMKTGPVLVFFLVGLANGLCKLNDYVVWWQNGNILVFFKDKQGELLNTILLVSSAAISFYFTSSKYLEEKNSQDLWLTLSFLTIFLTFFIPRTESWSITDMVSVKFVAYLLFLLFLGFFMAAWLASDSCFYRASLIITRIYPESRQLGLFTTAARTGKFRKPLSIVMVTSVVCILLLMISFRILADKIKIYGVAADAVKDSQAIYIGDFLGNQVFLHIIGSVVPIIIAIVLLSMRIIFHNPRRRVLTVIPVFFLSQLLISIFFNRVLNLGTYNNDAYMPFALGFILVPVLFVLIYVFYFITLDENAPFFKNFFLNSFTEVIYGCTVFAAIGTDLILAASPTGKILIGGGSILDGVFLLPVINLSLSYFSLTFILLLINHLRNDNSINE